MLFIEEVFYKNSCFSLFFSWKKEIPLLEACDKEALSCGLGPCQHCPASFSPKDL